MSDLPWYSSDSLDSFLLPSPMSEITTTPNPSDFSAGHSNFNTERACYPSSYNNLDEWFLFENEFDTLINNNVSAPSAIDSCIPKPNPTKQQSSHTILPQSPPESVASTPSPSSTINSDQDNAWNMSLSPDELQRLTAIAMGLHSPSSLSSASSPDSSYIELETTSPVKTTTARRSATKKTDTKRRKSNRCSKSNHNLTEKRYRTNLNSKIAELRQCLPELKEELDGDSDSEGEGTNSRHVSKGKILAQARQYIAQLERINEKYKLEIQKLRSIAGIYPPLSPSS